MPDNPDPQAQPPAASKPWTLSHKLRAMDFVFYLVYTLIGLQIFLELLGARDGAGFKRFIDIVTLPLLFPFRGLFENPQIGRLQFMTTSIIAIVMYVFLQTAIHKMVKTFIKR